MSNVSQNGLYYIQQVSDMTGLSKQVIRKWEERYSLIEPERLENGYRLYSQRDVNILLKTKLLSEQGHSIKQASVIVKELVNERVIETENTPTLPSYEPFNEFVFDLLEKGTHCNEIELNLTLQQAYTQLGLELFISSVVIPFLKEIGHKWEKGEWSEDQEAVSSLIVRDFLVQIRRNYRYRPNAPFVLGACLPNEYHEVPLHLVLLQFMMKGWKTQLVGTSPAPGSIESLVVKLKPDVVLLSATTTAPFEQDDTIFSSLKKFAVSQPSIHFFIGGEGAIRYLENKENSTIQLARTVEEVIELTNQLRK